MENHGSRKGNKRVDWESKFVENVLQGKRARERERERTREKRRVSNSKGGRAKGRQNKLWMEERKESRICVSRLLINWAEKVLMEVTSDTRKASGSREQEREKERKKEQERERKNHQGEWKEAVIQWVKRKKKRRETGSIHAVTKPIVTALSFSLSLSFFLSLSLLSFYSLRLLSLSFPEQWVSSINVISWNKDYLNNRIYSIPDLTFMPPFFPFVLSTHFTLLPSRSHSSFTITFLLHNHIPPSQSHSSFLSTIHSAKTCHLLTTTTQRERVTHTKVIL